MALNPLSFSVGVKDEASEQLQKINTELNNLVSKLDSIKNIAISLGGDPGEAESLMKSLNGVAASLASISKLSPEAQAASDRLTASQQKLNEATEMYNNLLAKIKAADPTKIFMDATKGLTGLNFNGFAGGFKKLDPTEWAGFFKQFLVQSSELSEKDIQGNVAQLIANIRRTLSESLSKGTPFASILEESFNFNSVNQKLNEAFAKLREEYIKGVNQLKDVEANKNGLNAISSVLPGLQQQVETAQKEFEALKNVTSSTPINPEAFKGAEGAIAATNEATKMLGEAINKLDFTKINTALDQLAERLNKLVTELAGIEERMKTAFTGALEANVKSLGDVIDGLAKKMSAMSAPVSEGMKQAAVDTAAETAATERLANAKQHLLEIEEQLAIAKAQSKRQESNIASINAQALKAQEWMINGAGMNPLSALTQGAEEANKAIKALFDKVLKGQGDRFVEKMENLFGKMRQMIFDPTANTFGGKAFSDYFAKIQGWSENQQKREQYLSQELAKVFVHQSTKFNNNPDELRALIKQLTSANKELRANVDNHVWGAKSDLRPEIQQQVDANNFLIKSYRERLREIEMMKAREDEILSARKSQAESVAKSLGLDASLDSHSKTLAEITRLQSERKTAMAEVKKAEAEVAKVSTGNTAQNSAEATDALKKEEKAAKELGQTSQQAAEQIQKMAQSTVAEAFKQLAKSLEKIKELFDNLGKAEGLTQLNNTINGVNTAVEALSKTLSNVNNAVKFTGSTEEIAAYEAKVKSLQEQVAALEAKAKGLGETAKAASEQVKTVTASGGGGGSSKDGLTEAQLKRVNDQLELLQKRLNTIEPNYNKAKELGFKDEVIEGKIKHLQDYIAALNEAVAAGSLKGAKVGDYSLFSRAANEDVPTQAQAQKMAKQMQEYIAIQQQAQAEAERQAQAQERMRQAAEAAGMSIVKAGDQTQSAGQKSEGAKQQMHGFNEEILVNMRSWEKAGEMMAVLEKRIFAVMAQLQSGKALGFDTGSLQTDIQELMRFYAIMKEIRNNYGFANIEGAMLTTSKVLKESGLDFGQTWERNKQELTAVKTIYEQMMRLKPMADFQNTLPSANLNPKYQEEALANAKQAEAIMKWLQGSDLRKATAFVGGQDYKEATAGIEAFFRTYNQNANIAKSQTAELQRLLEKIQGTDKGGGWISVMKSAGVSEEKINEMRQLAQKIETAIRTLEQNRQMGTAANYVRSDEYRATVIEGKKANDTGYLAVREAHEQAAAEREAAKATQESAKAAEKKREEMSKAWREQEAARQKEAAAVESSMQKQMAAEEKARQKSIEDAWKAADQFVKAKQEEAATAAKTAAAKTKEEVKGYDEQIGKLYELERAMSKRFASEQEAQRQYNALLEQTKALKDRILAAEDKAKTVGADTSVLSGAWMKAYNFQEKLQGVSEKDQKTAYRVGALEEEYKKLAQALTQAAKEQEKLNAATEKAQKKSNDDRAKEIQREETNTRRLAGAYQEAQNALDRLESAGTKGMGLGLDVSSVERAMAAIEAWKNTLSQFSNTSDSHAVTELIGNLNVLKRAALETAKAQEQMNAATEKANKEAQKASQKAATEAAKQAAQVAKDAQKENEKWAASQAKAGEEANKLAIKIRELQRVEQSGSAVGVDTSKLKAYIRDLEVYRSVLESIANGYRGVGHTGDWLSGKQTVSGAESLGNTTRLANEASAAVQRLTAEKQKAASSTNQLTSEEQRLAQALNQTAESAKGQSQVLSDLKMMATQYLGVWGGQQFLHNIIEIGGQLEMQRMSIGAILQNQSQANDLFEKIKGLAIQSPFGVVELDQMTKQLTAYGFKYSELFDMTKRLADISAATGTGVDRLALALGHVRSEAALSGYTLRQFSMGNVPLLQKLSEKLGKTTQEIRKMVRSKEISYEDVEGVIKDLTNEGGMFYNMQETISQSVKARFKNVKDAMAIMYGEMAESGIGDVLKSVADNLMTITKNWKDVATVMGAGAAVWAVQRAAIMAYTAMLGKSTAATFASIGANVKKQGVMLQLANKYRVLTTAERDLLNASRANSVMIKLRTMLGMNYTKAQGVYIAAQRTIITNTLTQSLSEGKLTVAELAHMVATRKLTHTEARLIIMNSSLDASMKEQMLSIIGSTRQLSKLELAYHRVGMAMKSLGSMALSFLPMAAITGLIELWQRNNQELERAEDLYKSIFEASQEGLKNARTMMKETDIGAMQFRDKKLIDVTSSFGVEDESRAKTFYVKPEFDESTAEQVIERWSQFIRDYAGTPNQILNNALKDSAENVRMLKDQFDTLYNSVTQVIDGYKEMSGLAWMFAAAQDETGSGVFNEDVVKNIQDYEKALKTFNKSMIKYFRESGRSIQLGIDAARASDKGFADATEGMSSYIDMLKKLTEGSEEYSDAVDAFKSKAGKDIWYDLFDQSENVDKVHDIMEKDLNQYIKGIKAAISAEGKNPKNLDESTKQGLMSVFTKQFIGSLGNISDETRNELIEKFAKAFNMSVDAAEEITEKRLRDWQKRAKGVFEVNTTIKVKAEAESDINEFAKKVQEDLKKKQDYIANMSSHIREIVIKMPINVQPALKFTTESIGKVIASMTDQIMKMPKGELKNQLWSQLFDEIMPFYDALRAMEEDKKWLKQEGFPEKDPTKDKSKNKKDTKKTYKDPVAEEWKERIRLLKDANQLYKEWNKRSGEDAALNRVREQYGDIFEKWRTDKNVPWKDFKAEDIIEYRNYVQKIVDEAQKRYDAQRNDKAKNYGKEAEAVLREGKKLLDDIDRYDFDEKAKDFTAAASKSIEQLTKRWEIFKQVADTTGDKLLAAQLAGFGDVDQGARVAAEAMRNELEKQIRLLGGEGVLAKIPFDVELDEESLRSKFFDAIGSADDADKYKESISGLVKLYQEWQKLQQAVMKDDTGVFAKVIGLAKSYDSQIKKIDKELQDTLDSIAANEEASDEQKQNASNMAIADADWRKMKLSADYANIHNNAVAMSAEEYKNAESALTELINRLREFGELSPEEFVSEMESLRKASISRATSPSNSLGAFATGGVSGLKSFFEQQMRKASEDMSKAAPNSTAFQEAKKEYETSKDKVEALEKEIAEIQAATAVFDSLSKAATLVANLFNAIGKNSNEASAVGSIAGGVVSGASSLSSFGKWGFAAGAILGGATAMIQAGDKAAENAIKDLQGDIQVIESDVATIVKQRERTLGYDSMSYLQRLYQASKDNVSLYSGYNPFDSDDSKNKFHAQWGAGIMRDFYESLFGSAGSGYQAQYNALIKERENYYAILDKQNEKKNKSNEEIAETQKRIAELDDQIAYFAQDLAKELWSIDIKGWADQLSDALASAFENGENMAKAYRDTVTQIIQQMMQKMMQMAILEPMFERLQKQLFGENGKGGVFDPNNPKGSMSKITAMIGDFFGKGGEGEKAITASMEFMTAFQRGMQNAGLTVLNEASNTLSSSMQGTTEETSGLLAGYVNALRQDVSVNRILLTQFVSQMWPDYIETFASQVTAVQNIDNNVQVIMTMMQMGNGAMYDEIAAMRARIDNVVMGIDKFSIR